ncbi:hypothetical protein RND61_15365 [Streptomyces sp. TRM76323]|uniref:Uncharacterized protein n=1 Tax=Streptomyces tamarix TaxID=3078565 RepID=A0ABU3QKY2_9ACTN|nr:hypothetical protein [Streptomyces tamarix]MDT9683427.1 hypothetical protein [Streptomyces tamarix]
MATKKYNETEVQDLFKNNKVAGIRYTFDNGDSILPIMPTNEFFIVPIVGHQSQFLAKLSIVPVSQLQTSIRDLVISMLDKVHAGEELPDMSVRNLLNKPVLKEKTLQPVVIEFNEPSYEYTDKLVQGIRMKKLKVSSSSIGDLEDITHSLEIIFVEDSKLLNGFGAFSNTELRTKALKDILPLLLSYNLGLFPYQVIMETPKATFDFLPEDRLYSNISVLEDDLIIKSEIGLYKFSLKNMVGILKPIDDTPRGYSMVITDKSERNKLIINFN